jgi:ribosome-interacting GTPase 1
MPANLTPEYMAAEEAYKAAKDPQEKLLCLERMLSTIPKHKGTEKMQADLKRRIARTREALEKRGGKKGFGISVDSEGAAQVVLVGATNSGKSALVEATTNARVEVGDHPFSTRLPVPAMLPYENIQFQLVDLPPISREHMEYWVTTVIRNADSALWVIDASDPGFAAKIEEVTSVLAERKLQLIGPDARRGSPGEVVRRVPTLVIAGKMDEPTSAKILPELRRQLEPEFELLALSAMADPDLGAVGRQLFALNRIVRVYSKAPGKEPNLSQPFIFHEGDELMDFARKVHKDFAAKLSYARVWGEGKFDGQRVPRDHKLADGDVIELRL